MKNLKLKIVSILFLLFILIGNLSMAAYSDVIMSVIKEPIATINFGDNSKATRTLISKDLNNKEITLELRVNNSETSLKPTGEIMLVIDNSKSMLTPVDTDKTREDLVINSAKTLITNLLKDNTKLKIGVVSFSTNTDIKKEGTIEDAQLISDLTNDSSALLTAVSNIQYTGPRTNLDSGITLAKKYYTENTDSTHKYMIILSDGVPNVAVDYDKNYYSDDVITKTKTNLQSLSGTVDNVITMLTGITDGDAVATPATKTYNEIISEIFGTTKKPTAGKFYYISDDDIESTITKNIYADLLPVSKSFKDLKIVDYFPKEIVDNFTFSYVTKPSKGTITDKIDTKTNSIIWTIPELKAGEEATVQYKLKLKENYSSSILSKELDTNTKLDLNYKDDDEKTVTKTSNITPVVYLEEVPKVIPKTGKTTIFAFFAVSILVVAICGIKCFMNRDI